MEYIHRPDCPFLERGVRARLKNEEDFDGEQLLKVVNCELFSSETPANFRHIFFPYEEPEMEILEWCVENFTHRFGMTQHLFGYFNIENEEDAMKLQLAFPDLKVEKVNWP